MLIIQTFLIFSKRESLFVVLSFLKFNISEKCKNRFLGSNYMDRFGHATFAHLRIMPSHLTSTDIN